MAHKKRERERDLEKVEGLGEKDPPTHDASWKHTKEDLEVCVCSTVVGRRCNESGEIAKDWSSEIDRQWMEGGRLGERETEGE